MYRLEDVCVTHQGRAVLRVPSLQLQADRMTVLLGHNGSGKSTLMSLLAGQARGRGQVLLDQRAVSAYGARALAQKVAYLPQETRHAPGLSVRELVRLGRFAWRGNIGRITAADETLITQAITRTGLDGFANHFVDNLSGGERQRAWLAMLLAQQARMFLLDEPVSALDVHHQQAVMALMRDITRTEGIGALIIVHDLNLAARYADRVIVLKAGQIAFDDTPGALMQPDRIRALFNIHAHVLAHPETGQPTALF